MKAAPPYVEYLLETMRPLGNIAWRSMFGGYALYCNGTVFALVASGALYLKADDQNRALFQSRGLPPFRPFPDKDSVMQYYAAPPEIFEDPDEMLRWCGGSVEAGQRSRTTKSR